MKALANKLSFVTQNVILGTVTGTMVAYNLKVFFQRVGGTDLVWVLFLLMGPRCRISERKRTTAPGETEEREDCAQGEHG